MKNLCMMALLGIALTSCASPSCNIAVHEWTPAEQNQMADDEQKYLPKSSILWSVLEECSGVRDQARACSR